MQKMCGALQEAVACGEETDRFKLHEGYLNIQPHQGEDERQELIRIGDDFPEVGFTEREAHCALLLILGFTSKESAEKMYLSPRTVEHYLANVKKKLALSRKSDIILTLLRSDFIKNMQDLVA